MSRQGTGLPGRAAALARVVVALSAALVAVGLLLPASPGCPRLSILAAAGATLGDRLMAAGILVLVSGPLASLLVVGRELARRRDGRLVAAVAAELLLLAIGLALGVRGR